ncbi:MAG: DUF2062 domain-containing protein [Pseudomonadota bacterium]
MTIKEAWTKCRRLVRLQYLRLMRQSGSPHYISMGMAVGVFVGFLPIIPFQSVVALSLAFIFRGSKVAAFLGTWVSNPVNMIPFYGFLYWFGSFFWKTDIALNYNDLSLAYMIEQGIGLVAVMVLGGVILGIPAGIIAYILTFRGIRAYRKRRMIAILRKHANSHMEP